MTQTSRLVLEIDSRDAEQKAEDVRQALGALEAAGLRVKPAMDQAGSGIDGAGSSARKAAGSIDGLADSSSKSSEASKRTAETFGQASNRLLEMAKSSLQASEYIKAMSASTEKAGAAFDVASTKAASLAALEKRLREESDANVGANGRMADASKKSTIATQEQATALANLLGRIDPVSRKLAELDKQEQELQRHRKSGTSGLDSETFKTYQATIDKNRAALGGFSSDLKQTGVSAAQTQAALRQLPAQFTDIFTSLAGGQNPLMVLIQQGGQIKDSFGGIDNTVEALGKKVKGFFSSIIGSAGGIAGAGVALGELESQQNAVAQGSEAAAEGLGGVAEGANTATDAVKNAKDAAAALASGAGGAGTSLLAIVGAATAAAAAIGLLIYGYNKGSQEADAFNQALTLTGNAAGTSSGALGSMARRISDATGTVGAAAAVLTQLASSSKIPASSFEMIATAALKLQDATGQAASKTVDDFEKIAKDPVKYSKELNDQLGYLTGSTYAQIDALVKQGDQQGAAILAEKAYAEALSERADSIKGKLGLIEGAWDGVKDAAKGAWDAVLDIGREDTFEQKLIKLEDRLNRVRNAKTPTIFDDNPNLGELGAGEDGAQSAITDLYVQKAEDDRRAAAKAESLRLDKESIANQEKLSEALKNTASNAEKLKARYSEIDKQVESASRRGQAYTEAQIKQLKDAAAEQYKDKKPVATKAYTEDAGLKMLDAARQTQAVLLQQNASLNAQGIATEKVGVQAQALIKWEQQLANIKGKKTLTTDQKSLLASQDLIGAQLKRNAGLEREAELAKSIQATQKDQVKLLTLTGQLRAANSLGSSLDYAAQMNEYERQGNVEAIKRLELMIKIRDINLQSAQKPGTVEGVSQAPQVQGLDASVGGAYSEIDRLNQESAKIDAWRTAELAKQKAYLDLSAISEETYAERVANIREQGRNSQAKIEQAKNQAIMAGASDFFGNMASLSQSGNKKLAAIGKAAAIAQATIDGYAAIQKALAAFPPPFNFAAAAAVGVATTANVANIAGIGFSSGGYTGPGGVNEVAGTVHKGEVVWSQKDIQRYGGVAAVESLRNGNVSAIPSSASGSASGGSARSTSSAAPQINITIHADGTASTDATAGYEERAMVIARAVLAAEGPGMIRSGIMREKGQNGLLDPSNRRNAA